MDIDSVTYVDIRDMIQNYGDKSDSSELYEYVQQNNEIL